MQIMRKQVTDDRETQEAKNHQVFSVPASLLKNIVTTWIFQRSTPKILSEALIERSYETAITTVDQYSKEYQSQTWNVEPFRSEAGP